MKRRLLYLAPVLLILASIGASLVHPPTVSADAKSDIANATFSFSNYTTIVGDFGASGKIDFVDKNPSDSIYNYAPTSGSFCNPAKNLPGELGDIGINLSNNSPPNFSSAKIAGLLNLGYTTTVGVKSTCNDATRPISVTNPNSTASNSFEWNGNNISTFNGQQNGATYAPAANASSGLYIDTSTGSNSCGNAIVLNSGSTTKATLYLIIPGLGNTSNISHFPQLASAFPSNCLVAPGAPVTIQGTQGTAAADGGASGGGSSGGSTTPTCDSGSFSLNWILCPIYNGVANASDWILDNLIQPELQTEPICLDTSGASCSDKHNITYKIWSSFRLYGDIFLVIALLVIVFGETIGGGLIDAYTVKKVLPRLLAAAILINLSIYIVALLVDLTNVVGGGIGEIITAPLKNNGAFSIQPSGIQEGAIGGGALIAGALGAAPLVALVSIEGGTLILIGLVIPAILALIAVLVTIIIRKAAILALILVSPVAFALYCLPNTEKYFKRWWDLLFEMLIVYPLIVLIFSIADVLSVLTGNLKSSDPLNAILSFMLLIIPLFMIPFAFRIAGQTIGRLHEAVNGGRQRLHSMTQSRREHAQMRYGQKVVTRRGDLYSSGVAQRAAQTPGLRYITGRRREAVSQQVARQSADFAKDPRAATIQNDDNALRAATYTGYNEAVQGLMEFGLDQEEAQRSARAVQTSIGFGRAQQAWSGQQMGVTGTAFRDIEDVAQTIARASGGNRSTMASMAGNINAQTKQAGRHDLAPSFGTLFELSQAESQNLQGGTPANQAVLANHYRQAHENAWNSASLYQHANDKPQNLEAHVRHFEQELASGDPTRVQNAGIFLQEMRAMQPNTHGEARNIIDRTLQQHSGLLDTEVVGPNGGPVVRTRTRRDPNDPNNMINEQYNLTMGDALRETGRVRDYQRPDPNNVNGP